MHSSLSPSPHSPLSHYNYNHNYNYHTPSPYHTPTKQTPPHSVLITHHSSSPKKYSRYISTHLLSPVHDNYTTSHSIITFSPPSTPHLLIIDQSQPISPIPNVPLPKKQPVILSSLLTKPKTTPEQKSDDSDVNGNTNSTSPPASPTQQENKPNTPENVKKTADTSDDTQKDTQPVSKSHPQHHSVPIKSVSTLPNTSNVENDQLLRAKSQPTIKNRYDDSPSTDKKKSKPNKSKNHSEKVFGVPLKELLEKEAHFCIAVNPWVPEIVEELMCYLYEENAMKSEGLFRQSGTVVDVNYIKTMYDKGKYLDLMMYDNPHVIASALKLFLKEIPDPLIPYSAYNHFIKFQQDSQNNPLNKPVSGSPEVKDNKTPKYSIEYLQGLRDLLFTSVVYECLVLLKLLAQLLVRVVKYERYNRMTPSNLAIVIGPNIIRSKDIDPFLAMAHYSHVAQITESIIRNEQFLFEGYKNLALNDVSLETLVNKRGLWLR